MTTNDRDSLLDNPGSMLLYDAYWPGLMAGAYRFILQQTIQLEPQGTEPAHHYYRDQPFFVQGPRFYIDTNEVHACYPPPGATGNFSTILPHVVLGKRALPWERTFDSNLERRAPWLALIVLCGEELAWAQADMPPRTVLPSELVGSIDGYVIESGQKILLPRLKPETLEERGPSGQNDQKSLVKVIDLPLELFLKVCPPPEDLSYLAHLRCVNTDTKAPLEMHSDGEFSVLVANRLPQGGDNLVHLVSLEGWASLLEARTLPAALAGEGMENLRARLVTLGSWRFTDDRKQAFTFGSLMQGLECSTFGAPVDTQTGDAGVSDALVRGYVPIDYRRNGGGAMAAWYRGPLAALDTPLKGSLIERLEQSSGRPTPELEEAVAEATGVPDISYASAWQLGRLLAMASPAFSSGVRLFFEDCGSVLEAAQRLDRYLAMHRDKLFYPQESIGENGTRGRPAIVADLVDWLARLVLLYPVPFHYLVADQRLLPAESLRFFNIDNNWVQALAGGALSIAIHQGGTDLTSVEVSGEARSIHKELSRMVSQYWRRQRGLLPIESPKGDFMEQVKSGFLIRSAAVSGWPGLEMKVDVTGPASAPAAGTDELPAVLRMDRLSPDVLLCVVPGTITSVTFTEPPEGLKFGVDELSENRLFITARLLDSTAEGAPLQVSGATSPSSRLTIESPFREGMVNGVLNIKELAGKLVAKGQGSAAFAAQMIRSPERQTITWTPED